MTIDLLKTGVQSTPETSFMPNIPQTMENVQHYVPTMIKPLSQTFRKSL
jgi:hypothetical protein